MFEAHLSDAVHGEATTQAATAEEAVEAAFRQLARGWMDPTELANWSGPLFDGEIRGNEVWWENRAWSMIGTVRRLPEPGEVTVTYSKEQAALLREILQDHIEALAETQGELERDGEADEARAQGEHIDEVAALRDLLGPAGV